MSIGTRSYARPYGSRGGLPKAVQALLIANTALFLILFFGRQSVSGLFSLLALTPADVVRSLYVWQLGTFLFVHSGIMGFLFNMLALYMFGRELEEGWGTQRFLQFYFLCGSGAGACVILAQYLLGDPRAATIGSTPAIYGILAASAVLWPEREVIFFFFPMKMKYFVILIAAVDFLLSYEAGVGAIVLLLAGLLIGVAYVKTRRTRRSVDVFGTIQSSYKAWKLKRAKRKFQVYLRKHGSDRDPWVN